MQGQASVRRAVAGLSVATVIAVLLSGVASAAPAAEVAKVRGAGTDKFGLDFEFRARDTADPRGRVFFETNSFGDFTGRVDCLNVKRRKAGISGALDNPNTSAGLTHVMIIMKDVHRRQSDPPDEVVTWLRNGPFDCDTDPYGSLGDSLEPIGDGRISVTPAG